MQWSGDRNAGFSRADPQRLYLPVIMDPLYGYQTSTSRARSAIVRHSCVDETQYCPAQAAQSVWPRSDDLFEPGHRKILAYVRHDETDTILVLANLSNQVQPVGLDLSAYEGLMPQEMFGGAEFPAIGTAPYFSPWDLCVLLVHYAGP